MQPQVLRWPGPQCLGEGSQLPADKLKATETTTAVALPDARLPVCLGSSLQRSTALQAQHLRQSPPQLSRSLAAIAQASGWHRQQRSTAAQVPSGCQGYRVGGHQLTPFSPERSPARHAGPSHGRGHLPRQLSGRCPQAGMLSAPLSAGRRPADSDAGFGITAWV
jgi:hypothetical protein